MIALLLRALLAIQVISAALLALLFTKMLPGLSALSAVLLGLGSVISFRAALVANNFWIAQRYICRRSDQPLSWRGVKNLYFGELQASLIASSWHMALHRVRPVRIEQSDTIPVLLVHGYGCNSGYWRSLSRHLTQARIVHAGVDLEPVLANIDSYQPQMTAAVNSLCLATGQKRVVIVAHSMGGLVARAWIKHHGCGQIAKLITIGTPHYGTEFANFGVGHNARQMRRYDSTDAARSNPWLHALNNSNFAPALPVVSIYSLHDNIVVPSNSSHLADAKNIALVGVGHVALGSDPVVMEHVLREIIETRNAIQ
jgi:triacylglycerol lipase